MKRKIFFRRLVRIIKIGAVILFFAVLFRLFLIWSLPDSKYVVFWRIEGNEKSWSAQMDFYSDVPFFSKLFIQDDKYFIISEPFEPEKSHDNGDRLLHAVFTTLLKNVGPYVEFPKSYAHYQILDYPYHQTVFIVYQKGLLTIHEGSPNGRCLGKIETNSCRFSFLRDTFWSLSKQKELQFGADLRTAEFVSKDMENGCLWFTVNRERK